MIKLKSLLTEGRENSNCWLSPAGRVIPVEDTHSTTAIRIGKVLGYRRGEELEELFHRGYQRVTWMYDGSLLVNNPIKPPNEKQISKLKDIAVEGNHQTIEYDNEHDKPKILWSYQDVLQEGRDTRGYWIYPSVLLFEFLNKDAVKTILQRFNKEKFVDDILKLDPTPNLVYSPRLAKFFAEKRSESDDRFFKTLESYFKKFLILKNKKLIRGKESDINSFKRFEDFHNYIDSQENKLTLHKKQTLAPVDPQDAEEVIPDSSVKVFGVNINKKDVTYMDSNVIVVRADNAKKSIEYGNKFSNWCTAKKTGNLFYTYRFDNEETMYFVYFPNKNINDNESVLHFGVDEDGKISYTDRTNKETDQTLKWLINKFPELKPAYENNAFEFKPLSHAEIKIKELGDDISLETFRSLSLEERTMWLQAEDRDIGVDIWNELSDELKNYYVYDFKNREDDVDEEIFTNIKGTPYYRTYIKSLVTRMLSENKLNSPHEYLIAKQTDNEKLNKVYSKHKKSVEDQTLKYLNILLKDGELKPGDTVPHLKVSVFLNNIDMFELPFRFTTVDEHFSCFNNNLTSLQGAPQTMGGSFVCFNNNLTSLQGAPQSVGGGFSCAYNNLTSLQGAPQTVGGNFSCTYNNLTSLQGAPRSVNGNFSCAYNNLTSLQGAPRRVNGDFDCRYLGKRFTEEEVREVCDVKGNVYV